MNLSGAGPRSVYAPSNLALARISSLIQKETPKNFNEIISGGGLQFFLVDITAVSSSNHPQLFSFLFPIDDNPIITNP